MKKRKHGPGSRGQSRRDPREFAALVTVLVLVIAIIAFVRTRPRGEHAAAAPEPREESQAPSPGLSSSPGKGPPSPSPSVAPGELDGAAMIRAENELRGTTTWRLHRGSNENIEGYADHVSAERGEEVTLYVSTPDKVFHVEAYRLGYYQGKGGRLVWRSKTTRSEPQRPPDLDRSTNMVEARWKPSLRVTIGDDWTPGVYLLKLVASKRAQSYVPLVVRDDASRAALVFQSEVTTSQAYNRWGGYSLYLGPDGSFDNRARVVSYDRPYASRGGAGQIGEEQPFIQLVERLGLDVTYWTDIDLHERPQLLARHKALISLAHDEYWSTNMFDGAIKARARGVNLAFFGANAIFRRIRLEPSRLGPDRHQVNYKVGTEDPLYGKQASEVTSDWRAPPGSRPESEILGGLYQCNPVHGDMEIADASSWVFEGTGLKNGDHINDIVGNEYDQVDGAYPTPKTVQILAHSPVVCRGQHDFSDMSYYTTKSGAGVFDVGTQGWVGGLECGKPIHGPLCDKRVMKITENVLRLFSRGPAGKIHPSKPNYAKFGVHLSRPLNV